MYLIRLVDIGNNVLYKLANIPFNNVSAAIKIIIIIYFVLVKAFYNNHSI